MAAAAFFLGMARRNDIYPDPDAAVQAISKVASDDINAHNPLRIPLILVTGTCKKTDREILAPRLRSLGAELISVALERL